MKISTTILSATLLAGALALAGCGGSSDDQMGMDDMDEMCPEGQVGMPPDCAAPPPPEDRRLESAVDAAGIASDARAMAMKEHMDAVTNAGKTAAGRKSANGSSQTAYMNVLDVLGAEDAIKAQYNAAMGALDDLKEIDTSDMSDADRTRIEGLVMHAEGDANAIKAILDDKNKSLASAVASVKSGTKAGGTSMERAAQKAGAVATAIKTAIAGAYASSASGQFEMSPPSGVMPMEAGVDVMSVEEILGGSTLSATGMDALKFGASITAIADGDPAKYMGIDGKFRCLSAIAGDCTVTSGKVAGPVLFVPDDLAGAYVLEMGNEGDDYIPATNYATYAYWLNGPAIVLHADSHSLANSNSNLKWDNEADGQTSTTDLTANYKGTASGFSERKVGEGDAAKHESGEFMANVNLKATFTDDNTEASLAGRIDGFAPKTGSAGSGHVNTGWVVELNKNSVARNENQFSGVVEDNSDSLGANHASSGTWTAFGYGAEMKRPSGFVGAFDAMFVEDSGSAAGVFQAD